MLFFELGLDVGTKEVCKAAFLLKIADGQSPAQEQLIILKCFREAHFGPKRLKNSGTLQGLLAKSLQTTLILTLEELEKFWMVFSDLEIRGKPRGLQI